MSNPILVTQATRISIYSGSHIRYLIRRSLVVGQKVGGVWLVDRDDLRRYERETKQQGTQKHTPRSYR